MPAHVLVALDEAYFEYTEGLGLQDGIEWLREFPNLVVFRTFSKAYGLAGVRVGYAVSHPSVADMLNRVRQAFNVSVVGLAGAAAALDDTATSPRRSKVAVAERARVAARLEKAGTRVLPSAGNFLMLHAGRQCEGTLRRIAPARHHRAAGRQLSVCPNTCASRWALPNRTIVS